MTRLGQRAGMSPEDGRRDKQTMSTVPIVDEEQNPYNESPWIEGVNDLGEVIEGIQLALRRPERFSSEQLSNLASEIQDAARRCGVYEPID
jgi:hypothetical protein